MKFVKKQTFVLVILLVTQTLLLNPSIGFAKEDIFRRLDALLQEGETQNQRRSGKEYQCSCRDRDWGRVFGVVTVYAPSLRVAFELADRPCRSYGVYAEDEDDGDLLVTPSYCWRVSAE